MSEETVTVTIAEELFAPVQYHSFRVGPISATTTLRKGETHEQAWDRVAPGLKKVFEREFELKLRDFRARFRATKGT